MSTAYNTSEAENLGHTCPQILVRRIIVCAGTQDNDTPFLHETVCIAEAARFFRAARHVILDNWTPVKITFSLANLDSHPTVMAP